MNKLIMATRSTINKIEKNGIVKSIYCHFDGYPSHHLPILEENYKTEDEVDALISLGDISSLGESLSTTTAYCRDRGEAVVKRKFFNLSELQKEEYNYVWENGKWRCLELNN